MRKRTYKYASLAIFGIAMVLLTLLAIPFIRSFKEPEEFKKFINGFGPWGILMMLFIQVAQIIVALIPGEFIEFVAGTLYGWFGGLIFCLAGIAIGHTLIFKAVKTFGKDFIEVAAGSKAMNKMKFLNDEKKLKAVIFILFFIPGTPKDLITYIVPLTQIKLRDFLIISLFARVPSIVSSTYAGDAFVKNDYITLIIAYAVIIILSLIGYLIYRLYEARVDRRTKFSDSNVKENDSRIEEAVTK